LCPYESGHAGPPDGGDGVPVRLSWLRRARYSAVAGDARLPRRGLPAVGMGLGLGCAPPPLVEREGG